jgi:hypothetical protein
MPASGKAIAQAVMVIDLAVEHDPACAVFVRHRLNTGGAVDDCQPPVSQSRDFVLKKSGSVRPAMFQDVGHRLDHAAEYGRQESIHRD